jgi:FtsH-binding integral membrane protein
MLRLVPRPYAAAALGLIVAGLVLLAFGEELGALAVTGLGCVLMVGLAFYAVGRSEDLDRERQGRR